MQNVSPMACPQEWDPSRPWPLPASVPGLQKEQERFPASQLIPDV